MMALFPETKTLSNVIFRLNLDPAVKCKHWGGGGSLNVCCEFLVHGDGPYECAVAVSVHAHMWRGDTEEESKQERKRLEMRVSSGHKEARAQ